MKDNAIIVKWLNIEKIYVDFSNLDNINAAINAERVSTIHTARTQELSARLGVHLMGFVDRNGDDINNVKACEISGYDYLGSMMLLCKTDDKYNAYGFDEDELDRVYTYLTTGKVKTKTKTLGGDLKSFLEKYNIQPPLPDFSVLPRAKFFDEYPNIVLLTYEYSALPAKDISSIGEKLFSYSSILVNEFTSVEESSLSADGRFYINCKTTSSNMNILIQVVEDENDKILINEFDAFLDEKFEELPKDDEDDEDDEEYPGSFDYVLEVKVDAEWPEREHLAFTKYKLCYPLLYLKGRNDKPRFPFFDKFFKVYRFDHEQEVVGIKYLSNGKMVKQDIALNKPFKVDFDYLRRPKDKTSRRVGNISFLLRKLKNLDVKYNGNHIEVRHELINKDKESCCFTSEKGVINGDNLNEQGLANMIEVIDGTVCLLLANEDHTYAILLYRNDQNEDLYLPVENNIPAYYEDCDYLDSYGCRVLNKLTAEYENKDDDEFPEWGYDILGNA